MSITKLADYCKDIFLATVKEKNISESIFMEQLNQYIYTVIEKYELSALSATAFTICMKDLIVYHMYKHT